MPCSALACSSAADSWDRTRPRRCAALLKPSSSSPSTGMAAPATHMHETIACSRLGCHHVQQLETRVGAVRRAGTDAPQQYRPMSGERGQKPQPCLTNVSEYHASIAPCLRACTSGICVTHVLLLSVLGHSTCYVDYKLHKSEDAALFNCATCVHPRRHPLHLHQLLHHCLGRLSTYLPQPLVREEPRCTALYASVHVAAGQ